MKPLEACVERGLASTRKAHQRNALRIDTRVVRQHVEGTFEGLAPPPADTAVAVGGTATSLRRLVGAELEHETLERGIRVLSSTPIGEVADRFELDPERVRLLPAGILILEAISDLLGLPLRIARGGLREGLLLELVEGRRLG